LIKLAIVLLKISKSSWNIELYIIFYSLKYNICGKHVEGKIGWKIVMCDRTLIQILLVYHLPTNPPKTVTTYTHKINCSFNKKYIGFCITRWKTKTKLCPINPVVSITNTFFLILRWKIKNKLCPINSQTFNMLSTNIIFCENKNKSRIETSFQNQLVFYFHQTIWGEWYCENG
jgi:hypothetical protein